LYLLYIHKLLTDDAMVEVCLATFGLVHRSIFKYADK
jgi:hypothetical protein